MKKIIFISLLFLSCIFTANAQWQQVLQSEGAGPMFAYRGNLLCRTSSGIHLSTDTGKTWTITNPNSKLSLFAAKDSLLFCAEFGYTGVCFSADSGKTWKPTSSFPGSLQCFTFSGNNLLAGDHPDSMYLSMDFGQTWILSDQGLPYEPVNNGIGYFSFINMGTETIVLLGNASYITYDHEVSWHFRANGCPPAFNIIAIGKNIYAGAADGILRSADTALSWQPAYPGRSTMNGICTDGHYILASSEYLGIVFSKDSGNNWGVINNNLPISYLSGVAILGPYIFCSSYTSPGQVFRMSLAVAAALPDTIKYTTSVNPIPAGLPTMNIYPDPVQHSATVSFGQQLQDGSLQIFNVQGQRVQQVDQIVDSKITLQPNNLPPGTYTYILTEQGKKTAAGKFIIQ